MLTKKDIADLTLELKKVFETKRDLQDLRDEFTEFRHEVKNDILQFKDDILFEIKAMREELAIVIGYRQTIENHEDRIVTLEKKDKKILH